MVPLSAKEVDRQLADFFFRLLAISGNIRRTHAAPRVLFASHPGYLVRLLKRHNHNSQRNVIHFIDCASILPSPAPAPPSQQLHPELLSWLFPY